MSLAGVDPTATTGISGDATNVQQVEQVAESRESRAQRRDEISHTNITMGMDVITKQFIYTGTYTWKTTDAPGTVLATFPIHPDSCNSYTNHVYQMFNAWVGGMKARIRIIGTAFYGGGLYFVRIPPNFSASDIAEMNLAGFSAFPHSDMDPKNLTSIDIDLQDYRSSHFHSGELLLDRPDSFAGWLAIVVNARLVTQSSDVHSLDLRVEMAGGFDFKVPRPIREKPTEATGPLTSRSLKVSNLRGCDDIASSRSSFLAVLPNTDNKIVNGNVFMRRAGGDFTYMPAVNSSFATTDSASIDALTKILSSARAALNDGSFTGVSSYVTIPSDYTNLNLYTFYAKLDLTPFTPISGVYTHWKQINAIYGTSVTASWVAGAEEKGSNEYGRITNMKIGGYVDPYPTIVFTSDTKPQSDGAIAWDNLDWGTIAPSIKMANVGQFLTPDMPDPYVGAESIVGIITNNTHSFNAQPLEWAEDLKDFDSWPTGSAALYSLYAKGGNKVAEFKLRDNGHLYAVGTANTVAYTGEYNMELKFEQWVPDSYVLNLTPAQMTKYTQAGIEATIQKLTSRARKGTSPGGM